MRGTFTASNTVGDAPSSPTDFATIGSVRSIPTLPSAVLGTIAGGTYFGSPGMFFTLANIASGEEQSYQLVDDNGVTQVPPNTVNITATSLGVGDWVSVFRLNNPLSSGGQIVKNDYTSHATNNVAGDADFVVQTTINDEAPPSGVYRVVYDTDQEDWYAYSSFTASTFTNTAITDGTVSAGGGDTTGITLTDTGATGFQTQGVLPGMIVRNTTDGSYGIVKSVTSETVLVLETQNNGQGLIGGTENDWDVSDAYTINKLRQTYDGSDTVYVPFLDVKNTSGSQQSTTIIQTADIDVVFKVRQGGVILPFTTGQTIGANGMSQAAIRTLDTIAT